jgi:diguanylate cyclase (GGDEF)-like protein
MQGQPKSDLPTVLVVDDEAENLRLYTRVLRTSFNVVEAPDGQHALETAKRTQDISVVVTDQRMPGMLGVELLHRLSWLIDVPKIIVTAYADVEPILMAINSCSLYGYLLKPVEPDQLRTMVRRAADEHATAVSLRRTINRLEGENGELRLGNDKLSKSAERLENAHKEIAASLEAMQQAYARMAELAHKDDLTGAGNRRAFIAELEREFSRFKRYRRDASLLLIDVDHFKAINDRRGHPTGDRVLVALTEIVRSNVRDNDGVYRLGGDEFAVILPETSGEAAATVSKKLDTAVRAWTHADLPEGFRVSIGRHPVAEGVGSANDWYALADASLYQAKRERPNAAS